MDTVYSKAYWLGRNLNLLAIQTQGKPYPPENTNLAKIDHYVKLFARGLNLDVPALPDLTGESAIARLKSSVKLDLALVQSEFVSSCFLFGFDYSSWINIRCGHGWSDSPITDLPIPHISEVEANLRRQALTLGLNQELEACLSAAHDKSLSDDEFRTLAGSELLLKMVKKLDQLDPRSLNKTASSKELFIVMPMIATDPALEDVVETIRASAAKLGLHAYRVDQLDTSGRISDSIITGLKTAGLVVVDLTHARPNVYWEAGFCHGLGKLPVYIARSGTLLEFDVKDYPVIYYSNMKQLREGLEKRLASQLQN